MMEFLRETIGLRSIADVFCLFDLLLEPFTHDIQLRLSLLKCLQSLVHLFALVLFLLKVSQQSRVAHQPSLLLQPEVVGTEGVSRTF